jgi:glycerophosphoryl diester phosphodiesterase
MEYYIVNYRPLQEGDMVRLRAAGLKTALWTPNDPPTVASLAASGADALIQNYPAVARRTLVGEDPFPGRESVVVQQIANNVPGDDMQPENGEHVVLRNLSSTAVDLTGWYMRDDPASRLAIGDGYSIPPGGTLRVYVGTGTNTADRYYNGLPAAILSNGGDSIALHRPDHRVVHIVGNDLTQ